LGDRENIEISAKESLGYYELKMHKPWFDDGSSELLDQRKQTKFQLLQDRSKMNGDNLNNIRCETSKLLRNKNGEYLKAEMMSLQQTVRTRTLETYIKE
jgi:hypothetical protein